VRDDVANRPTDRGKSGRPGLWNSSAPRPHHVVVRGRVVAALLVALASLSGCGERSTHTHLTIQLLEFGGPTATSKQGAEARAGHASVTVNAGSKTFSGTGNGHGLVAIDLGDYAGPITISEGGCDPSPSHATVPTAKVLTVNLNCPVG